MQRLLLPVYRQSPGSIRYILNITKSTSTSQTKRSSTFLNGGSSNYMEAMYEEWKKDPKSVHQSWDIYFRNGTSNPSSDSNKFYQKTGFYHQQPADSIQDSSSYTKFIRDHERVHALIRSYQMRGHKLAQLDPLEISSVNLESEGSNDLDLQFYNFSEADLDRKFFLPETTFIGGKENELPLREIIRRLQDVYCQTVGLEYMYINNYDKCNWIRKRFEDPSQRKISNEDIKRAVKGLIRASRFEEFLKKKCDEKKRFSLEGLEALIPAMKMIINTVAKNGVDTIIMGMPHRGRLNVLANVTRKPLEEIFAQFNENLEPSDASESGDVKYHLGTHVEYLNRASNSHIKLSLVANPSHLEVVNPVVQGKTRAEQYYRGDKKGDKIMSILLHGDAAFAGQGVVYETFHLSDLPAYTTHGTIHIVCNNQIGFTTDPRMARSSPYCTDVARVVNAPIFHVNADDGESVLHVSQSAAEWRCIFKKDVVIDLVGYRRYGHNEQDEPRLTQAEMYKKIDKQTPVLDKWGRKLIKDGIIEEKWYKMEDAKYKKQLNDSYAVSKMPAYAKDKKWIDSPWKNFFIKKDPFPYPITGISEDTLNKIAVKVQELPQGFTIHTTLNRIFNKRSKSLKERQVDWALAESMAIGSILLDGHHVRLSGQDVERGTFSHRHHVIHDQQKDSKFYVPLNNLSHTQAHYTICNSSLSELAILGFEVGYSTANPNSLILWEAQYGDFSNMGQCVIDQFISSGQAKWVRQSGIVLLLPHGYEGQGPEHSSARLERFLQMVAEDEDHITEIKPDKHIQHTDLAMYQLDEINWIIANPTTPANYFHILRRQVAFPFRKPLVIMSPKSLLRSEDCRSSFDEMINETTFQRIYSEDKNPDEVKKLIFCSGKTYYDLTKQRDDNKLESQIAIIRIEQLSPFPFDLIRKELEKYKNAKICFAQEEHKNMGSYSFCKPRLATILRAMNDERANDITYAGRDTAAATATGKMSTHKTEQKKYMSQAMAL